MSTQPGPRASSNRRKWVRGAELFSARRVAWAGWAAALLVLVLFGLTAWGERQQALKQASGDAHTMARVLEDQATRSIDTAALTLAALAQVVAQSDPDNDRQLGRALMQSLASLPVLRDVSVLDAQGLVLASTDASAEARVIDLSRWGALPAPGSDALLGFVAGRGLASLVSGVQAPSPAGVGFVPMVRHFQGRAGRGLLLVGLINPDVLANQQQQLLADTPSRALLAGLQGQVWAAAVGSQVAPGDRLSDLPVFKGLVARADHGDYQGQGTQEGEQLVAYRVSRSRPVVVVVETAVQQALQPWLADTRSGLLYALLRALGVVLLCQLAVRSLKARESARQQRDQAQADVALRERELSVIVKSVQELLFRTDAGGRVVFVNARWAAAAGFDLAQAQGLLLSQLVRPDSAAVTQQLFSPEGSTGARTAQVRIGSDAHVREFELIAVPLLVDDHITGFAGSAMDVTDQRRVQAQLRAQLSLTAQLLEMMPLPLSMLDERGHYQSVNRAWEEFTGRQRDDVLGRAARSFLAPAEADFHDAQDRALLARGGSARYEAAVRHRDGSQRDLAITKAVVPGAEGRPAGILAAFMDVTEFREAERATREARDAAEEASRSKTEFIGNISHELRTPLQSILGFSELGKARSGGQPKLGMMFGDIHAAGQRMLALVNDLLDVAKIESAVGTFHLERTDVRALVREVANELAPLIQARQLRLDLQLSDAPLVAKVDPLRFQQVLRNVMANAIRFSPLGAPLTVQGDIDPDTRIQLAVVDQGPGIPPAELDQIFEAFVQSSKTKDGSGGTGLGLAISRKILKAHGGEIRAENNDGGGSTFRIYLPSRGFAETQPLG
jgi:PAS domain S-box-containing protein